MNRRASSLAVVVALAMADTADIAAAQETLSKYVNGVGVIVAIDVKARQLKINHEEIKGFMGAMEMVYPVTRPALLKDLKPGDKVKFVVLRRNGVIERVEVAARAQ